MSARDLRRCSLRGAIVVAALYAVGFAVGLDAVWLVTSAFAGLLVVGLAWIEVRVAGRAHGEDPSEPFLVWLAATLGLIVLFLQAHYVAAFVTTRSFDQALTEAWRQAAWVVQHPMRLGLVLFSLSCPFALAAHVRLRGYEPRAKVFFVAILLLVPSGCASLGVVFPVVAAVVVVLLFLYALADWLDARLWSNAAERAAAEALPHRMLWLLAYLGHAPARLALGLRAPESPAGLEHFMLNLESAGRATVVRAATLAAGLVVPFLEEARRDDPVPRAVLRALEAWLVEPSAASRDAARALVEGWTREEPGARALREAVGALDGEPPMATHLAVRAAARAASFSAEVMGNPAEVREVVRRALLEHALAESTRGAGDAGA